jgi:exodeoxyribonuclease-1
MTQTFYWYDLETSGTDPRWDRIVQFAGLRTDTDLNEVGDALCTYVTLPDDVLPNPDSTRVTGITPERTRAEGLSEWQAMTRIHALFAAPGTCVAGYNSLRFDDEFVRFTLYRNFIDPNEREWRNGKSRWDLLDLAR